MTVSADIFTEANLISEHTVYCSTAPYYIVLGKYITKPGCWEYSRGQIYHNNGYQIADVKRNYPSFLFEWCIGHTNGHDYLLCSENYMGQTVIELDTGKRADKNPEPKKEDFCTTEWFVSADKSKILITGCYWACAWSNIFLKDFSDPLSLPWPVIKNDYDELLSENVETWDSQGILIKRTETVKLSDNTSTDRLSSEEWKVLLESGDIGEIESFYYVQPDQTEWDHSRFQESKHPVKIVKEEIVEYPPYKKD